MANIENIKVGNTAYGIRDKNTYRSLSALQESTLLSTGKYEGEDVENNTVFQAEGGAVKKFYDNATVNFAATDVSGGNSGQKGTTVTMNGKAFVFYNNITGARYTSDGSNWTTITLPSTGYIDAAYFNGKYYFFTATTYSTTTDFSTWESGSVTGASGNLTSVSATEDSLYALFVNSNPSTVYKTTDGSTWAGTLVSNYAMSYIKAVGSTVVVCGSANDTKLYISKNGGTSYSSLSLPYVSPGSGVPYGVAYGNGTWVVVSLYDSGLGRAWYSDDDLVTLTNVSVSNFDVNRVVYGANSFIAVKRGQNDSGSTVWRSTDYGRSWSQITLPFSMRKTEPAFVNDFFIMAEYYNYNSNKAVKLATTVIHDRSLTPLSYSKSETDTALAAKQGTLTAGTGIDISDNVISAPAMTGATSSEAGAAGIVPAPTSADVDKFLKGDGSWGVAGGTNYYTSVGSAIVGQGTPTSTIIADLGQIYVDSSTGLAYVCSTAPIFTDNLDKLTLSGISLTNHVLSGFSTVSSIYARVQNPSITVTSCEICVKATFLYDSTTTSVQAFCGQTTTNRATPQIALAGFSNTKGFNTAVSSQTASWDCAVDTLVKPDIIGMNTYYVKIIFDGAITTLTFLLSKDGISWTEIGKKTDAPSTILFSEPLELGNDTGIDPLLGTIDLRGTYIKINGSMYWEGATRITDTVWTPIGPGNPYEVVQSLPASTVPGKIYFVTGA